MIYSASTAPLLLHANLNDWLCVLYNEALSQILLSPYSVPQYAIWYFDAQQLQIHFL